MYQKLKLRRDFLKIGGAIATVIPLAVVSTWAHAAKNESMRASLKYQDKPNKDQKCSGCLQFVPGKTPTSRGGCKVIAGDTEISPDGYCIAWAKKT